MAKPRRGWRELASDPDVDRRNICRIFASNHLTVEAALVIVAIEPAVESPPLTTPMTFSTSVNGALETKIKSRLAMRKFCSTNRLLGSLRFNR